MPSTRLSELDWLRVVLILAVFLHHAMMPFNGDDWHIMNAQSSKLLDDIMVYFEQLRLPVLFFIAGVGSAILLHKVANGKFLKDKFFRLFIPLLIGIVLIVPPQGYFENKDRYESYWQAYPSLLADFEMNHLWFIGYLVIFSLLAVPIYAIFKTSLMKNWVVKLEYLALKSSGLMYLALALVVLRVGLKFVFPSSDNDIENLSSSLFYFYFFLAGMLFIQSEKVWISLSQHRRQSLYWLIAFSAIFYAYYFAPDLRDVLSLNVRRSIWWGLTSLVSWSALLAMLGYAQHYLSSTPAWLKTSNELIYPFYIFHQTVVVILAYYIVQWQSTVPVKALAVAVVAFLITAGICLVLIYPFNLIRKIFGLKAKAPTGEVKSIART